MVLLHNLTPHFQLQELFEIQNSSFRKEYYDQQGVLLYELVSYRIEKNDLHGLQENRRQF